MESHKRSTGLEEVRARVRNVTLDLPREEMRKLGYAVVDLLVEYVQSLGEERAVVLAERREMEALLREPLPEQPQPMERVLAEFRDRVLAWSGHVDHPRFFGYIPGSANFVSVLGDALASGCNFFSGNWLAAPAPIEVEIVVLDWFKQMLGFPREAGGILTSGGSMSIFTGLAVARHERLGDDLQRATLYVSDQAHASVARAARLLGVRSQQIRVASTGADQRVSVAELKRLVDEDVRDGRRPFAVVANAGTTNTGSVDPLGAIADFCRERGLWLHVDAAYGGFAVLTERGRRQLAGIEHADSITLDPHKWLFQPFESGCLLVRDARLLRKTFAMRADYLQDVPPEDEKICFFDYGPELSRGCRALKIWMSLKAFGTERFRQVVDQAMDLTLFAQAWLEESPFFEILSPAQLGIVCFRYVPRGASPPDDASIDRLNEAIVRRVLEEGHAMLSSTRLAGRFSLRLCILNFRTRLEDVENTLRYLESLGRDLTKASG
jgi:aromatic-L-amino-acid decarboxylase